MSPVFGPPLAECALCSLKARCEARQFITSHVGKKYAPGGLMLVGEFPAKIDVQQGRMFAGRTGQLLDALLEEAGIDPESIWYTSTLLATPPSVKSKDLKANRVDIYACLPRLDAEIAAAQPRVIVALGQLALEAFTGHAITKQRLYDNPCGHCNPETRKVGPVIQCFNGACKYTVDAPKGLDADGLAAWRVEFLGQHPNCLMCDTSWKRAKPKMVACPECGGKKKTVGEETLFVVDRVLTGREGVVGAVFPAEDLPGNLTELGVRYMIPTYSPALLIVPTRDGAKAGKFLVGGQFAARAAVDHLRKARELLTRDASFVVNVLSTENLSAKTAAKMLDDYTREPGTFTVDIETDAKSPWDVTTINCVGIHRVGGDASLVVDTRAIGTGWATGNPLYDAMMRFLESEAHGKIFHNGPYDTIVMLRLWGVEVANVAGDTLPAHAVCYPDEEHGLGFCAHELTDAPAWKGGSIDSKSGEWETRKTTSGYETFADLALYNARDLVATEKVWIALNGPEGGRGRLDVEGVRATFRADMEMYPIAIEMEVAGLPLNPEALAKVDREQTAELAVHLQAMREAIDAPDFLPTPAQLIWAMHDPNGPLKLPVLKTTEKTQKPALDADTLKLYRNEPFVASLLRYKKIDYNLSHFVRSKELRTGDDGRLHPAWKIWGAKTGRWTSNPNCFSGDTELLTDRGWRRFDTIDPAEGLRVAQYHAATRQIDFVHPEAWIKKPYDGTLLHIATRSTTLKVTPDHRCLVRDRRTGKTKVVAAKDYPEDFQQIHAGLATDVGTVDLPHAFVRFLVALQADGSLARVLEDGTYVWAFAFDKTRKSERLEALLRRLPYVWKARTTTSGGRTRRRISVWCTAPQQADITHWLVPQGKLWTWRWLDATHATREVFLNELQHWDGSYTRPMAGGAYSSSERINADVVQALFTLSGRRGRLRAYAPASPNARTNWQVDVTPRDYTLTTNHGATEAPAEDGFVYCVSVPSSFVVTRVGGNVSITGQCQNWPGWMRAVFVAPEGRAFVGADQAQLEMRIMASLSGDEQLIHRCATADEGDKLNPDCDPHSYVASLVFGASFTALDRKDPTHVKAAPGEPPCKCEKCRRATLRDIVKRVVYGLNYGAGAETVLEAIYNGGYDGAPLTVAFIQRVTQIYFKTFPAVPLWRNRIVATAEKTREIRSPLFGRHRIFPLGQMEPSVLYNYPIQSGGADIMAHGLMRLKPRLRKVDPTAMFIAQIHDAIYIECDERRAEDVAAVVTDSMTFEMALSPGSPPMPYVASAAIGPNLAAVK